MSDLPHLMLNLVIAALLGALIAFHPLRLRRDANIDWEMKKCQILICILGVILVEIVAGELALAFALVGVGSFIRFRTAVQNPLEGAIIFVQVMIGMACGGNEYWMAVVFTGFVFALLLVLNVRAEQYTELWEVKTQGGTADHCRAMFEQLATAEHYRIERLNLKLMSQVFVCRFRPPSTVDVPAIDQEFLGLLESKPDAIQWNCLRGG
ncbi:MgtC/SapB family protein [Candidatus Sumerlaeota bacterium]|nr:MgtC/SapB family protein [Candidatus Sumerlaeota bacterium]